MVEINQGSIEPAQANPITYGGKTSFFHELSQKKLLYFMALPGILVLLMFCYVPMAGIYIAFTDYNVQDGIFGSRFVGLENFSFFFTDGGRAWRVTCNTVIQNFYYIIAGLFFQIGIALCINEIKNRTYKRLTQSMMFFPYFLSWVVIGAIVYSLFSSDVGVVNTFLKSLGLEPIRWYAENQYWRSILVGTNIWKWSAYGSIVYLATMSNIDPSYYEAAVVDGATRFQQLRHITLPFLVPTAVVLTLFAIGRIFYGDFGMVYGVIGRDNGIILETTEVIDVYVFTATRSALGYATASTIGVYQSVMGLILILISNHFAKKINDGNALF